MNVNAVNLAKSAGDERPWLVYWMWSDENDKRGKETKKADRNVWDTEKVARASRLFNCFRVDAKQVPAAELQKFGVKEVPFVQVLSQEHLPVASTRIASAGAMETFLQTSARKHPEYWRSVVQRMGELEKLFDVGKAAMKKKDYEAAISAFDEIYKDNVRTDLLDKAREELAKARKKAEKEEAKK